MPPRPVDPRLKNFFDDPGGLLRVSLSLRMFVTIYFIKALDNLFIFDLYRSRCALYSVTDLLKACLSTSHHEEPLYNFLLCPSSGVCLICDTPNAAACPLCSHLSGHRTIPVVLDILLCILLPLLHLPLKLQPFCCQLMCISVMHSIVALLTQAYKIPRLQCQLWVIFKGIYMMYVPRSCHASISSATLTSVRISSKDAVPHPLPLFRLVESAICYHKQKGR